jgi:hypothetical protein
VNKVYTNENEAHSNQAKQKRNKTWLENKAHTQNVIKTNIAKRKTSTLIFPKNINLF